MARGDSVPLLRRDTEQTELEVTIMPGSDMETIDTAHGAVLRDDDVVAFDQSKSAEYKVKVDELSNLVAADTIAGGRTFSELSLYEKKSVLINRELE